MTMPPDEFRKLQSPIPPERVPEALRTWVAAESARHAAIATYNERLQLVMAERERNNWSMKVDVEYAAIRSAEQDMGNGSFQFAADVVIAYSTKHIAAGKDERTA